MSETNTKNLASALVCDLLVRALELDLVGPTPALLVQLEAESQRQELHRAAIDAGVNLNRLLANPAVG